MILKPLFPPRRLFARLAYEAEWARSIVESHEPSPARDAALQTHKEDVRRIELELVRRGADPAALGALIDALPLPRDAGVAVPWFHTAARGAGGPAEVDGSRESTVD